jgi:hypothetical protein
MRIFDVYEHPSFEADKTAAVRTTIRRLGVGATVSAAAIAAISFWGYYWSDPIAQSAVFTDSYPSQDCSSNTIIGSKQVGALHRLAFGALISSVLRNWERGWHLKEHDVLVSRP